jgi:hypothetical protein
MSPGRSRAIHQGFPVTPENTAEKANQGAGAGGAVSTLAGTLFGALVLVFGVTFSSLPASLAGVVILAVVAVSLHRWTGGRAGLIAGIVPWGMILSVSIPANLAATSPVNTLPPRELTGLIFFAFLFAVLGGLGTSISTAFGIWAWRRPELLVRLARPVAAAFTLLNLALAVASGARLARHPDASGYPATLPAGVPLADTDLLPTDDGASMDYQPIGPTWQARWDAAHGVWVLVDSGRVFGFVGAAKKGELVSMHPAELGLAPPSAWVGSSLLVAALSVLAIALAWAARRGQESDGKTTKVTAVSAAVVASGGASAITGSALLVYQIFLSR